jgi:hypothetical protein
LQLEELEPKCVPSTIPFVPPGLHETLDHALDLGVLSPGTPVQQAANIGGGSAGAADVDFFHFNLAQPATVSLAAAAEAPSNSAFVLSLYNTDPSEPMGNRLIAQADGNLALPLAAGDYYVGVSGAGNLYYNAYLADSGYPGATGNFDLALSSTAINLAPGAGPVVLRTDPGATPLSFGPQILRASLSGPIDPTTLQQDITVQLYYDATDPFTSSAGAQLSVGSVNYDASALEVQATPAAPLAPGYYRLALLGNLDAHAQVIETADATPIPLGASNSARDGQDYSTIFHVTGILGNGSANPVPDDTVATARDLGDVTSAGLVQVQGVIGDNPNDPTPFNPASVDFYHFQVTGSGKYAFGAEVFANRIDSPLDASMQLYRLNPDESLTLVAANDDSENAVLADNGTVPLFSDPVAYASVTAGDYYLAVTSQFTTYDPRTTLSAQGGFTAGPYVLNLRLDPATAAPHVVATSFTDGATLSRLPTTFTVQFDEPMNLQQLAYQAYLDTSTGRLTAVTIQGGDGSVYYPRLMSFDPTTNSATFLLIEALPNGAYTLDLSGPGGLTDLGGNLLVGNDPSGAYLVHFTVNAPPRGTPGNPTTWLDQEPNDDLQHPQQIGTLFPMELENTVTISRPVEQNTTDSADYFEINVLQTQDYLFTLSNLANLPADTAPQIWANGVAQATIPQGDNAILVNLKPGTYVIGLDWSSAPAAGVGYDMQISILGSLEPATSLTTGPVPALRLRLAGDVSPAPSSTPAPADSSATSSLVSTPTTSTAPNPVMAITVETPTPTFQPVMLLATEGIGSSSAPGRDAVGASTPSGPSSRALPADVQEGVILTYSLVVYSGANPAPAAATPQGVFITLSDRPLGAAGAQVGAERVLDPASLALEPAAVVPMMALNADAARAGAEWFLTRAGDSVLALFADRRDARLPAGNELSASAAAAVPVGDTSAAPVLGAGADEAHQAAHSAAPANPESLTSTLAHGAALALGTVLALLRGSHAFSSGGPGLARKAPALKLPAEEETTTT